MAVFAEKFLKTHVTCFEMEENNIVIDCIQLVWDMGYSISMPMMPYQSRFAGHSRPSMI